MVLQTLYPGATPQWQLLWLQNVVFVFVQFTTGAALYADDTRYLGPLSTLGTALARRTGRDTVLTLHAGGGLLVIGVNLAFVSSWYLSQSAGVVTVLRTRPAIGSATLLLTAAMVGMGVFGLRLYGAARPGTVLPVPPVPYATARKAHRGLFALLVAVLGYHLFLTPRVTLVWTTWLAAGEAFGLLTLALVAVWGLLAGHAVLMLGEWAIGRPVSGWNVDDRVAGGIGGGLAIVLALALTLSSLPPSVLVASVLCVAVLAALFGWRARRSPAS